MKRRTFILFISATSLFSCTPSTENKRTEEVQTDSVEVHISEGYELHKVTNHAATLVLYPGGGTSSVETKQEFDILKKSEESNVSVLLMNFSNHLWISERDCQNLTNELEGAFEEYDLNRDKIYIGGMSVGGTVAASLSNYLITTSSPLAPQGVFIVDSPVDLYALYQSAEKDILREDFSEERLAEPRFIMNYFEEEFGTGDSLLLNIAEISPFTYSQGSNSVSALSDTKLRFYTEPDSTWWRENRDTDYENTNSYVIQQIAGQLESAGWEKCELIETEGKGYRANGDRHPHSWSIVDVDGLIEWMME